MSVGLRVKLKRVIECVTYSAAQGTAYGLFQILDRPTAIDSLDEEGVWAVDFSIGTPES